MQEAPVGSTGTARAGAVHVPRKRSGNHNGKNTVIKDDDKEQLCHNCTCVHSALI